MSQSSIDENRQAWLEAAGKKYFANPDLTKFLLVESLAVKMYLHGKGLIDPEEYAACVKQSEATVDAMVCKQLDSWRAAHPKEAASLDALTSRSTSADTAQG